MARTAAIIGAGQIGYAAAQRFASAGWDVTVHARTRPEWLDPESHRFTHYVTGDNVEPSAEAVVDTIAFDADDIAAYDPDTVGRLIAVSSASVYCDANGRTLDEAAQNGFPEFARPIDEDDATVPPGDATYSTRKVRMENRALELFGDRATILRPCAVHGPWSRHPREWWFVKRLLDGRVRIPLLLGGESVFHTTTADTIGVVAVHAAKQALGGPFNIGDRAPPSVLEIGSTIAGLLGRKAEFIRVEGSDGSIGRTPWSVPLPFTVSSARLEQSGFTGSVDYTGGAQSAINWLADRSPGDWRKAFPQLVAYPWDLFDYDSEDHFIDQMN
ncbi:Rossmann-fold NAD(P)-binding domain-containing protein [Erythrobacter rubeus]|uniref:Reductase n=1 Tax=Erythrobacter rubeus TaxID=2760803 RepID=A0ABR8KQG0_9SPHN|nr:reductase [Erythrobacter rubeus]MBD2841453.1 reductase [Erythrobacter rubeus]